MAAQRLILIQKSSQRSTFSSRKLKKQQLTLNSYWSFSYQKMEKDYVMVLPEQLVMIWIIFKTSRSSWVTATALSQMHLENFSACYHNPTFTGLKPTTCSMGETWCQTLFSQISQLVSQFLSVPRRHCGTTPVFRLLIQFSTNSAQNITQFDGYSGYALKTLPTTSYRLTVWE